MALVVGGTLWLLYRLDHTVVHQAMVKGRLHRIGARLDGRVKAIEVILGQRVLEGDVLVRLEDEHLVAAVRLAQAELVSASKRSEAEQLAIDHERQRFRLEVERAQSLSQVSASELEAALSRQEKLEREYQRTSALAASGLVSPSELDRCKTDYDHARALVQSARNQLAAAESSARMAEWQVEGISVREAGLAVMAADVERMRQKLAGAEADAASAVIRAPEDGWIAERIAEPGGSVKVGEPILVLWGGSPWVEAWADERALPQIHLGSPVDVTLSALPERALPGRVEAIGVLADNQLQTAPAPGLLRALFPNNALVPIRITVLSDEARLQPGLSAVVGIKDSQASASPVAERSARSKFVSPSRSDPPRLVDRSASK